MEAVHIRTTPAQYKIVNMSTGRTYPKVYTKFTEAADEATRKAWRTGHFMHVIQID